MDGDGELLPSDADPRPGLGLGDEAGELTAACWDALPFTAARAGG